MTAGLVIRGAIAAGLLAFTPAAWAQAPDAADAKPAPFSRMAEADDGTRFTLEIVSRTFARPGHDGPSVTLVGAVHIADQPFYDALQEILEGVDVVLFEGVKPPGAGLDEHADDNADLRDRAKHRLDFLASAVDAYRARHEGRVPATLDEAADSLPVRLASLVRQSTLDPWGNPVELQSTADEPQADGVPPYRLISRGADGKPGGEGDDADIIVDGSRGPLRNIEEDDGIQARLAKSLGLVFQKDGMDWDRPHWRNSDLSIDQVMDRLDTARASGGPIFSMLDGSSFMAKLGGFMLRLVERSPQTQAMIKLMLIEMLGGSEDLMAVMDTQAELMRVLIDERNKVVIEDLRRIMADEPDIKTVGIIYGAGHLPDLEMRLERDLGFSPIHDEWHGAITVDLRDAGIPASQARQMRQMIRRSIETQLRQMR